MLPPLFTADYLSRLETLRIQTRRRFLGSRPGGHVSLRRGAGLEFAEYPATPPALTSARSWGRMPCVSMALPPQSRRSDERSVIRQRFVGATHPAAPRHPSREGMGAALPGQAQSRSTQSSRTGGTRRRSGTISTPIRRSSSACQ